MVLKIIKRFFTDMVIVAHIGVNVIYLFGNLTFTVVLVPNFEGCD